MAPTEPVIVVGEMGLVPAGVGSWSQQSTWTFDVCANSWQERGASSLPAPGERPDLGQFVRHEGAGLVLGLPVGLAPVWSYDAIGDAWTQSSSTGGGGEAWPIAVYDPDGERLLAFEAHNSTVKSYDLATDAWTVLDSADSPDSSGGARPNARMDQVDLAYDIAERQLILVITRPGALDESAETWAFDPDSRTWSRRADVPNTLELGYPASWAIAYDPDARRTMLFADTAMLSYDSRAAASRPGWSVPAPTPPQPWTSRRRSSQRMKSAIRSAVAWPRPPRGNGTMRRFTKNTSVRSDSRSRTRSVIVWPFRWVTETP